MKKLWILTLCLMLLLCACGNGGNGENTTPTAAPAGTETVAATQASAVTEPTVTTEAPETSAKDLASTCVDKSVDELYALIGEPESAEYAPSCLGEGEDGCLYYDGFTVYTYKDAQGETVSLVE